MFSKNHIESIFQINSTDKFNELSLEIFRYQAENCEPYKRYLSHIGCNVNGVKSVKEIPFLPIEFFKSERIICTQQEEITFLSSGTTGSVQSKHLVSDVKVYEQSYLKGFEHFYGSIKDYVVLALLPAYAERKGSSLIYMVDDLIRKSENAASGYYLYNHEELHQKLEVLKNEKVLLIGVSFALLDFVEKHQVNLPNLIVMETGGMKGRREELTRDELHIELTKGFGVEKIHSEYGMTELLSQAYSRGNGIFETSNWMKILIRDVNDPFYYLPENKSGGINIIDLANVNSCSFLATQDLGRIKPSGNFQVIGRYDNSDVRGCNLLVL